MVYYIWGIFNYSPPVPTGVELHKASKDNCYFYPFEHDNDIFTIDSMLWQSGKEFFFPNLECIKNEIHSKKNNTVNLVAVILDYETITLNYYNQQCLEYIPENIMSDFFQFYERIGIDLVDFMGVSGLVNMGYSCVQIKHLNRLNIEINEFGLVSEYGQARVLANILSSFVPEHSPFIPVEIWRRKLYPTLS